MVIPCYPQFAISTGLGALPACEAPATNAASPHESQPPLPEPQSRWTPLYPATTQERLHPLLCSPLGSKDRGLSLREPSGYDEHALKVLQELSFADILGAEVARQGAVRALHLFLRGDLTVEPTHGRVQELSIRLWDYMAEHSEAHELSWEILDPVGLNRPIYQIYTRELVDQLASYIRKVGDQLPCAPRIVEIAAGDGRLSRALRKRGVRITATDLQRSGEWEIAYPQDVLKQDGVQAALGADIILASWLPMVDADAMNDLLPMDVRVAQELTHCPHKTLILIQAHRQSSGDLRLTNSDAFENFTDRKNFQCKLPDELNFKTATQRLPQSRSSFPRTLGGRSFDDDGSSVVVYRSRAGRPLPGVQRSVYVSEMSRKQARRHRTGLLINV